MLGWAGMVFLSCCGIPQVIAAMKNKDAARMITWWYLLGWFAGVLCMLVYIHGNSDGMAAGSYPWPLQLANTVSASCAMALMIIKTKDGNKQ